MLKDKKVTGFTKNEEDAVHLDKVVLFLLEDRMKDYVKNLKVIIFNPLS